MTGSTGGAGAPRDTPLVDLATAIAANVHDGDLVFVGGFGHAVPFAAGHELIRQGRRDLALCRSGADILFDELIAAGCVRRVVFGWVGNPGIGLGHAFNRALAAGTLELEEWTNFSLMLRLQAAATGVPFLPTRVLLDGDAGGVAGAARIHCPFTGEELSAVPALTPDVALVHAQRASRAGDVQLWGVVGDTVLGALAARRIVVTVEELVDEDEIRAIPDRTVLPAHRISAIAHAPGGAFPSWVDGYYGRADGEYQAYDTIARDPARLEARIAAIRNGGRRA